jgi:hypothetical protein
MNIAERVAHHRRMAESYRNAYLRKGVEEGETYEAWKFADDAVYASPYFTGEEVIPMSRFAINAAQSATNEAKAYSLRFPDWAPADFKYWPAENGFVMKTRWEGCMKDGTRMGFYSYGFVETNGQGEISRWETHVNEEYGAFLEVAIGLRGPFRGSDEYNEAVARVLREAGVSA